MKKPPFYSIVLLLLVSVIVSCGPSAEELEARFGPFWNDSINAKGGRCKIDSILQNTQPSSGITARKDTARILYYSAIDFNLPVGTVVGFSPNPEWISENSESGIVNEQIYIHIKDETTNTVKVFPTDYKTFIILHNRETTVILK